MRKTEQIKKIVCAVLAGGLLLGCLIGCGDEGEIGKFKDTSAEQSAEEPSALQEQETASALQESTSVPATEPPALSAEEQEHTEKLETILTADYELIYEGISLFNFATHYSYFKYKNTYADLYMRRLQDDTGETVELSLWSEQKKIWNTVNSDFIGDCSLFWQEESCHLILDQRLCYYVVELDGTIYLMRYSVEAAADAVSMSYKVFGIDPSGGYEEPLDIGSITVYLVSNGVVDSDVSFPIEQMTTFADTVKGYMENGQLAASTLHGRFEFGTSADRDNPVSPYLYDIFPWMPELVINYGVNTEDIHSVQRMLTAFQRALPKDTSVTMPDMASDGTCFITGDYYSGESSLTVRMNEDGSFGGTILIHQLISTEFSGYYDNGILTVTGIGDDEVPTYEMEISFRNGKATVTFTAVAYEEGFVKVGDTFNLDRNEKPEALEVLKNADEI